jgi:prepilin-type N-terminal cleavage/methylation domain-containing protein
MKTPKINGHIEWQEKGFSLVESLISLSIFLVIVLATLEFFGFSRRLYLKLKIQEETGLAAFSALERMKTDLLQAGAGLLDQIHLGLVEGITKADEALIIFSQEKTFSAVTNLLEGQTRIQLESTEGIKKEREVCIFDSSKGELKSIASVEKNSIALSSPLSFSFLKEKTRITLLERISLFFDSEEQIIRRKVNSSPAQPLLEEAASFSFDYEKTTNIVRLRLALASRKEKTYEISVYPKNTAMANRR